jgi:hypothetical protein
VAGRYATEQQHAAASLGRSFGLAVQVVTPPLRGKRRPRRAAVDFTTAQRFDQPVPPSPGRRSLFEFLFSRAPLRYAELKRRASTGEPLPSFALDGVQLTIAVDPHGSSARS